MIRLGGAPPLAERVQVAAAGPELFRSVLWVCEAVLAFGIERHALVAIEAAARAQLGDQVFPLLGVGLLGRPWTERAIVTGRAQRGARVGGVPNQGRVDRLPCGSAIGAKRYLAAIELNPVIGVQTHARALARRAAIGSAGECLDGLGSAARTPVGQPIEGRSRAEGSCKWFRSGQKRADGNEGGLQDRSYGFN